MNERTIAAAERALVNFLKKTRRERDYFSGRLIAADNLPAPNQHMISAAMSKVDWYAVEINELEGELEMLREELGLKEDENTDPWAESDTTDVEVSSESAPRVPALKETARWRRERE
jgi:hypothetical protein